MKSILKPNNLRKLGQLTLAEKVQQISNTAEDEEEAAQELQQSMTPTERSRTWSKHQTHLNQPENKDGQGPLPGARDCTFLPRHQGTIPQNQQNHQGQSWVDVESSDGNHGPCVQSFHSACICQKSGHVVQQCRNQSKW